MVKKEDRRAKMTKEFLKHALIDLMKENKISDLSIKQVCEKADVNRSTFYKHYASINELYDEIILEITENIKYISQCAKNNGTLFNAKYVESILNYAENNRDLFLVVFSKNGNIGFGEFLVTNTDKILGDAETSNLYKYCVYFVVSGMTSIIWKWLGEENRQPAHSVARVISALLANGIGRAEAFSSI